jgi:Glycosyl transferase family 2
VAQPTDILMLTHNRLAHLEATVDALEARTRAPYRLTIVDNASGPEVRNWLAANRHRFHQLILRPTNEFLGALNHGIAASRSDPYMVTDPDLIVPNLDPCWLTRMRATLDSHPEFGLLGIGLDQSNLPSVQEPEVIDPAEIVEGEIVARPVGSVFCLIRRDALHAPYVTDWETCQSVARAGYRYGWALGVRAYHLGWDDFRLYPAHLASKLKHGEYREVNLIERAPTLSELALAGPVIAETRRFGIPEASVLELTWGEPAVAAAVPAALALAPTDPAALPLEEGAAGAVVLVDPPREDAVALVGEACRVGARAVVALASLDAFGSRTAAELAPPGWIGREASGPGDVPLALAAAAAVDPRLEEKLGVRTIEDREHWLALFAAGAFGIGERRLWIWERIEPLPIPDAVRYDPERLRPIVPVAVPPRPPRRSLPERVRGRARRELRVATEVMRIRALRLGLRAGRSS